MLMKDEGDEHYISASEQACVESSLIKSGPRWLKLHTTTVQQEQLIAKLLISHNKQ